MRLRSFKFGRLAGVALCVVFLASLSKAQTPVPNGGDFSQGTEGKKVPADVILVKGAWPSASDSGAPVPEGGTAASNVYTNAYFGLSYAAAPGWEQKYSGPPPSENGYYVLAQFKPGEAWKGASRGTVLLTAQDLFFALAPASNALEWVDASKDNLQGDYQVERPPTPVTIGNHYFVRFDYFSPVAELHWSVLSTQIRCHVVQFVFTSRDPKLTESLIQQMSETKLPAEASPILGSGGDGAPFCVKDYAREENVLERVDPVFTEHRFNSIPVRVIIDREGKVKHIHFLSAFPEQARAITDALLQWKLKPYMRNGKPEEVETGIVFGRVPLPVGPSSAGAFNE